MVPVFENRHLVYCQSEVVHGPVNGDLYPPGRMGSVGACKINNDLIVVRVFQPGLHKAEF